MYSDSVLIRANLRCRGCFLSEGVGLCNEFRGVDAGYVVYNACNVNVVLTRQLSHASFVYDSRLYESLPPQVAPDGLLPIVHFLRMRQTVISSWRTSIKIWYWWTRLIHKADISSTGLHGRRKTTCRLTCTCMKCMWMSYFPLRKGNSQGCFAGLTSMSALTGFIANPWCLRGKQIRKCLHRKWFPDRSSSQTYKNMGRPQWRTYI